MSVTSGFSSTANTLLPPERGERALAVFPRSPSEALEPMRPPELPDRDTGGPRHPFLGFLNGLFTLLLVVAALCAGVYYFVKIRFDQPGPLRTLTVVVIPKGEGVTGIADRLERDGVIDDRRVFMTSILYLIYVRGHGSLKAGEYEFPKHATMRQVLDTLVEGKSIDHKVTLAEGLTSAQIVTKLMTEPDLQGDITEIPPEGSLLPDTYKFARGDTRQDIIDRMRAAQGKFLASLWDKRDPDIVVKTPEEAVILASIVEKETSRTDERPRIASVFQNRLRKHMRLQSDPTVIYGLVGGKGVLDHPIQQDELERDTGYNTYKIDGLPPTSIANPGRASIAAELRPAKTKDLYFVADGSGGHAFAPSLDAHNKNVAHWREYEREQQAKAEVAAAAAAQTGSAAPAGAAAPETGAAPSGLSMSQAGALANATADDSAEAPTAAPAPPPSPTVPLPKRNPTR
jgi:UPF0755 protein